MITKPPHVIPSDRAMTPLEAQELQRWLENVWQELNNLETRVTAIESAAASK